MRATLHDHVPNTYYGQWRKGKAAFSKLRIALHCPSRARRERGVVTFDVPEPDFPANPSRLRRKFLCRPKKKKSARLARAGSIGLRLQPVARLVDRLHDLYRTVGRGEVDVAAYIVVQLGRSHDEHQWAAFHHGSVGPHAGAEPHHLVVA